MAYYEDEILRELIVGEEYSEKKLAIFVVENRDVIVISKSCSHFSDYSQNKHRVLEIINGYEHTGDGFSTYNVPSTMKKIYVVD